MKAFILQNSDLDKIAAAVEHPLRLQVLQGYLEDPKLCPKYADTVLSYAAYYGSRGPRDIEQARTAFLSAASRHKDPRVARLAKGYLGVQADLKLSGTGQEIIPSKASIFGAALNLLSTAVVSAPADPEGTGDE